MFHMNNKGRKPNSVISKSVSPEQIDRLRANVFNTVNKNLGQLDQVLQGTRKWDANQTRLFLACLDKVMPSLTQTHKTVDLNVKPLDQWSNEELLAAIEEARAARDSIVEHEDPPAPKAIPPEKVASAPVDVDFETLEAKAKDYQ